MWYLIVSIPDLCNLTYFKALPYISHQTWASVVKEPDSVACEQQRCRPVCASGQSDACLCNLLPGKYIAKQLNWAPLKALSFYLVSVNNKADFSKIWLETMKKRDAAHIEPAHYPCLTVTIQADRRHFHATCT